MLNLTWPFYLCKPIHELLIFQHGKDKTWHRQHWPTCWLLSSCVKKRGRTLCKVPPPLTTWPGFEYQIHSSECRVFPSFSSPRCAIFDSHVGHIKCLPGSFSCLPVFLFSCENPLRPTHRFCRIFWTCPTTEHLKSVENETPKQGHVSALDRATIHVRVCIGRVWWGLR